MNHSFPKLEKLCSALAIKQLYSNGKHFVVWPLRVTYLFAQDSPTQVLIWAPKSLFKHATDRNRLRRQMREAYRLNKNILEHTNIHFQLSFSYIDKEQKNYTLINNAMRKALIRLSKYSK
mgnify:CR=1 FL=1